MTSTQVAIVGAGPAGAFLAYLLASRGIEVTLLERQADFMREFRGEALTPSGVRAIRDIGLGKLLERVPTSRPEYVDVFNDRKRFLHLPFDEEFFGEGNSPLVVSQPHLLEAVVGECQKYANFYFARSATFTDLFRDGERVKGLCAKSGEEEIRIDTDLVIGADGRSSRVRAEANLPVHVDGTRMDVVWCKLPLAPSFQSTSHVEFYIGDAHLLISYRAPDDLLQLGWVIRKGTWGGLRSRGMESWVEEMANHVTGELSAHLREKCGEISLPFLLSTAADRCTEWSRPGVMVIGDAAHTCSPVGAQGINIALRDSIVAANHLIPALKAGANLDLAAKEIEAERMREVQEIQSLQARPPQILFAKSPMVRRLRGVTGLMRFGWVRALAARQARVFSDGVTEVELKV